jgi:phosphoribosylglycinamide formyltransferase-1
LSDPQSQRLRFAIFASGRGSNAMALLDAFASGFIPAEVALLFCNKPGAAVVAKAEARGIETRVIASKGVPREEHERQVLALLAEHRIDHVLLAGYMRILSPLFLARFGGSVINIHPSLLPDFPGLEGAERQWRAGVKVAGATVHFVNEGVDAGAPLLMGSLEVRGDEGEEGLASRILHEIEHVIYPRAVRLFIDRLCRAAVERRTR